MPEKLREFAYEDGPLPIEAEQTISQPYIVAAMIDAAGIAPGDKVLEIGAGSGYAAAVMGRIAEAVVAVERQSALARLARERMARLGYDNVRIVEGDGSGGLPEEAPFDAVVVAAAAAEAPAALLEQLAEGGRLVIPVGPPSGQRLRIYGADGRFREGVACRFVPLVRDC